DHWITSDHNASGDSSSLGMLVAAQKAQFTAYCAAGYTTQVSTTTLSDNVWYHLVGTYDGANSRLYVNGVQEDSDAQTCTLFNSVTAASIGRPGAYTSAISFNGQIDDVRVWNRALSATEVMVLYQSYR
ncbi:MAG: LamG domain-containing protein, partial [bacterium]|nr:LamG domain-containing protein [bacterium]